MSDVVSNLWGALDPLTAAFLVDTLFAIALGYMIGAEREMRGKDADSRHTSG